MQIMIDIPNENYQVILTKVMLACRGCKVTELPKGHGDLIDIEETNYDVIGYTKKNIDSIINKTTEKVVREKITDTVVGRYFKQMTVDVNINPTMSYKAENENTEYQKRYTSEEVGKILITGAHKYSTEHGFK